MRCRPGYDISSIYQTQLMRSPVVFGMTVLAGAVPVQESSAVLAQTIYEGLRNEIATGKLRPGEPLSRREVAKRYGTSAIPVIEALVRLEGEGLVESEARQAARVRRINVETIREDYVLREAYETQAIRLACQ